MRWWPPNRNSSCGAARLVAIRDGRAAAARATQLVAQLTAEEVGLRADGDVVRRHDERLRRGRVRVGQTPVGEAFREQIAVVPAPLCEVASQRDHVGPAVHGVPEQVVSPGDSGDEVVVGDSAKRTGVMRANPWERMMRSWCDSSRRGLVRTDRYVIVMFAPMTGEGKAPVRTLPARRGGLGPNPATGRRIRRCAAVWFPWARRGLRPGGTGQRCPN